MLRKFLLDAFDVVSFVLYIVLAIPAIPFILATAVFISLGYWTSNEEKEDNSKNVPCWRRKF